MDNNKLNFVTTYLRHRSAYTAYCIAYNVEDQSQYESIMCAAQQLMDDPEVGGLIRSVLEHVHYEVQQEIRAEQRQELLTVQRKRELLARIATGEISVMQHYKGKDCNQCTQMVQPTINQMIRAIDLDSKLAGHYPVKQAADNRQFTAPISEPIETSAVVPPFREDRRVSRAEAEMIIPESQQLSEAVSLRPLNETSISQQLSEAVSLRPLNETSISQQNTTNGMSPVGGGVRRTGVEDSRGTDNTDYCNKTQQLYKIPLLTKEGGMTNSE